MLEQFNPTYFYQTFIYDDRYKFFVEGLKVTILLTLASFILGILVAVLLSALKRAKSRTVNKISNGISNFFVQIPTMVLLMIFVYIIFGSSGLSVMLIVIIGLTIKAAAYLSDIFCTSIDAVAWGEIEAARTLGMTKWQAFCNVTLPQSIHTAMPLLKNQFISTMQETSIVGYLAIMDLTRASNVVTARTLNALFGLVAISIIYMVLGYVGQTLIGLIDRKKHIGGSSND